MRTRAHEALTDAAAPRSRSFDLYEALGVPRPSAGSRTISGAPSHDAASSAPRPPSYGLVPGTASKPLGGVPRECPPQPRSPPLTHKQEQPGLE